MNINKILFRYFSAHDVLINDMGLSRRSVNALLKAGYDHLSQMLFLSEDDIASFQAIGEKSVDVIILYIKESKDPVIKEIEEGIITEENDADPTAEEIFEYILDVMAWKNTDHMSLHDLSNVLGTQISEKMLLNAVRKMQSIGIAEFQNEELKITLPDITAMISNKPDSDEKSILLKRLHGKSLEEIGNEYGWSREYIRKKQNRALDELKFLIREKYGIRQLGHPLWKYIYQTYDLDKKMWLEGVRVTEEWYHFLSILYKTGGIRKNPSLIKEDRKIPEEIRSRIVSLIRRTVVVEGNELPKVKASLEDYIAFRYCRNEKSLDEFIDQYTKILEDNHLEDEKLRLTRANRRGAITNLRRNRNILWKQNEKLRYYDFDAYDFTDLLSALNLKRFSNCYVSTRKFMADLPDMMRRYDIRDEYELHGVLHMICDKKDYPDLKFGRMPSLIFGNPDRRVQMLDLLKSLLPIDEEEMYRLLNEEYGIDHDAARQRWLPLISDLLEDGYYSI